jgi:orotidine-5'-phosphate decarboxylase
VVLGLDPDPGRLWPTALDSAPPGGDPAKEAAVAVRAHCAALIEAAGPACVAAKLQLACFERLGAPGWEALFSVAGQARAAGLLVIADGKRGDVPVTATAYAQALVGSTPTPMGAVPGLGADALTASPLLGRDSLQPLVEAARAAGAGVFVLVRTSNPGAADIQDLRVGGEEGRPEPLWERLAALVTELGAAGSAESGLDDVGAVVGATEPDHLGRMRELMPRAVLLLPGVGAQGGRVADLAPAFAPGPAAALVAASRSIADAHAERGGDPAAAAREAAEQLRDATRTLAGDV